MARYFLELAYNGASYCGWQIQPNAPSVQQSLQEALSKLLREEISVMGAGRTDTGVHAAYYVAHFDAQIEEIDQDKVYHLNAILPRDIVVYSAQRVADDTHARFSATERGYRYYISKRKSPFAGNLSMLYQRELDIAKMNHSAQELLKVSDFTSFAKLHSDNKTNICDVREAEWSENENFYIFAIRADRFLRNMVRSVVGTLVDVGRGKITHEQFMSAIEGKSRQLTGSSAPAHGLYLTDIVYDAQLFTPKFRSNELLRM